MRMNNRHVNIISIKNEKLCLNAKDDKIRKRPRRLISAGDVALRILFLNLCGQNSL